MTLLLSTLTLGASAEVPPAGKKPMPVEASATPTSKAAIVEEAKPTGPVGFGPVKIDMGKEELDALTASDGMYLSGPLTPKEEKDAKPPEGTVRYEGSLNGYSGRT